MPAIQTKIITAHQATPFRAVTTAGLNDKGSYAGQGAPSRMPPMIWTTTSGAQ